MYWLDYVLLPLAQIETIRNMALRIHEIMQRFSSLEKEMNVVAQQATVIPANRSRRRPRD